MSLTVGIVGLPNVGKSTLFNAITKSKVLSSNYPFATIEPNVGVVEINDERLNKLVEVIHPKSIVYNNVSFTDIAGLVKGASEGEGLGNQFLSNIRNVNAICHVVRCFDDKDIIHVYGEVNPINDIETIKLELILSDLDVIEKRIQKVERKAMMKVDLESVKEFDVLTKISNALKAEKYASCADLSDEQLELVKGFNLLTMKPVIYVMNVGEDDLPDGNKYTKMVQEYALKENNKAVIICAKIEEELCELDDESRTMFLDDLGIKKSGLDQLIFESYNLLGLATFFTAGEKECRAWTFKKGMKAPECAGVIHSDFERGFIRAEVTSYDDFIKYGTMQKAKEAGKLRSEGKEYVFQDGDIVLFRFNV